jgi:hypothetical protein
MFEQALDIYRFNFGYAHKLMAELPDEQLCAQPVPGQQLNHAAFTIGHLAWASDAAQRYGGREPQLPTTWAEQFARGSQLRNDRASYPSKAELLEAYAESHASLEATVAVVPARVLAMRAPEALRTIYPTVGHLLLGLMTVHEGIHLGQLSAWRRAMGFPSVS